MYQKGITKNMSNKKHVYASFGGQMIECDDFAEAQKGRERVKRMRAEAPLIETLTDRDLINLLDEEVADYKAELIHMIDLANVWCKRAHNLKREISELMMERDSQRK